MHYMVIGVLSALLLPLAGVAALVTAMVLVWRWRLRRDPRPRRSIGSDT